MCVKPLVSHPKGRIWIESFWQQEVVGRPRKLHNVQLHNISFSPNTELFKKKYTLSKIYFTRTTEIYGDVQIQTDGRTLKVIFTPYKHTMWAPRVMQQMSNR
jgi:hypothetical protein